jgi:hypothetical protein
MHSRDQSIDSLKPLLAPSDCANQGQCDSDCLSLFWRRIPKSVSHTSLIQVEVSTSVSVQLNSCSLSNVATTVVPLEGDLYKDGDGLQFSLISPTYQYIKQFVPHLCHEIQSIVNPPDPHFTFIHVPATLCPDVEGCFNVNEFPTTNESHIIRIREGMVVILDGHVRCVVGSVIGESETHLTYGLCDRDGRKDWLTLRVRKLLCDEMWAYYRYLQ